MPNFNAFRRIVEKAINDSSDLGTRVSAEVDAAIMARTPREAERHAKRAEKMLQRNGRYAASAGPAIQGMADKYQEKCDENDNLTNENNTLTQRVKQWIRYAVVGTAAAGIVGLGIGYSAGYFSKAEASETAPVVRTVEETKPSLVVPGTMNKDLYALEMRADGEYLKVLGTDEAFLIPAGGKNALVTFTNIAESYDAKHGKISQKHYFPKQAVAKLKELYSQDAKSNYGAAGQLVKEDIEQAIKDVGE